MRSSSIQALAAGAAALLLGACAAEKAPPATGQVVAQVAAALATRGDVASVSLTLTSLETGWATTVQLQNSKADRTGTWSAVIPGLRAGRYDVYSAAKDASGNVLFETPRPYPSPATVTAGGTTTLTVLLQERSPAAPFQNTAPSFLGLTANQSSVSTAIQLKATAVDPDAGDVIAFDWKATPAGSFGPVVNGVAGASATTETVFTPPGNGSYTLTVTATDTKGAKAALTIVVTVSGAGSLVANIDMNSFPVVQSLTADDVLAQDIHFTAVATDLDGDALAFGWSADCAGAFDPPAQAVPGTSTTTFHLGSGQTAGTCTVVVTVRDGRDGVNQGLLTFGLGVGDRPVFRLDLLPTAVAPGTPAEAKVVAASGEASSGWTYAWDDGLAGPLHGSFAAAPGATDGSDQLYTPAACSRLGAGDHVVTLTVKATDGASGAWNVEAVPLTVRCPAATAWKFGLMADTQWTGVADDGRNPSSDAIDIALQLADRFVGEGVKFVVQVGDLTDNGSNLALDTRAKFTQPLYDAGIGYFPLRGNHESSAAGAAEFTRVFPQTSGGNHNATPVDAFVATVDDARLRTVLPPPASAQFKVGTVVGSPNAALTGLTYAVDYDNARLVLTDMFLSGQPMPAQLPWINATLAANPGMHAFTFSHKGLLTENHRDTLFGADPSADPTSQDIFINGLANNGVRIHALGHDHMHDRSLVATTDGVTAKVMQLVCASDSSKFYIPAQPSNDEQFDLPATKFGHTRQTILAQELYTVGYYVYGVDGPRVTVDFYGSTNVSPIISNPLTTPIKPDAEYLITTTPAMQLAKRESFGYSLNGKQFVIAEGQPYTVVQDAFLGTSARILGGTNGDASVDGSLRPYSRAVNTGWTLPDPRTSSAILTLWGMVSLGASQTDTYALSLSYAGGHMTDGSFGLAARDPATGAWVNAVDLDVGGAKTFVVGAWDASYGLGTYGIDPVTGTVWAVVNHAGDFAAASF
jgi:hypothetical protein